jgi:hypothetical protein
MGLLDSQLTAKWGSQHGAPSSPFFDEEYDGICFFPPAVGRLPYAAEYLANSPHLFQARRFKATSPPRPVIRTEQSIRSASSELYREPYVLPCA